MQFDFSRFFFSLFPNFHKENDTNKDINDRGLLERYLDVPSEELEDNFKPMAENYLEIVDMQACDPKFLNHIAYALGNPPDVVNNETLYRRLLQEIVTVFKIKGTIPSYQILFNLLGYSITITEYPCDKVLYDDGVHTYDDGISFYDKYCCTCSEYSIAFSNYLNDCSDPTTFSPLSQTILDNLYKIIFYIEPINAKLRDLTYLLKICEELNFCMPEEITWEVRLYSNYDSSILYDDSEIYDNYVVTDSDIISNNMCPLPIEIRYITVTGQLTDIPFTLTNDVYGDPGAGSTAIKAYFYYVGTNVTITVPTTHDGCDLISINLTKFPSVGAPVSTIYPADTASFVIESGCNYIVHVSYDLTQIGNTFPSVLPIMTPPLSVGLNGSIIFYFFDPVGVGNYTFLWSTGATTASVSVPAGSYSVTVTNVTPGTFDTNVIVFNFVMPVSETGA